MATSILSAGATSNASSSATTTGNAVPSATHHAPVEREFEGYMDHVLLEGMVSLLDRIQNARAAAYAAASNAEFALELKKGPPLLAGLIFLIKDQTCDRADELTMRAYVQELTTRFREVGRDV